MNTEENQSADILSIDTKIRSDFKKCGDTLDEDKEKLNDIISCLGMKHLNARIMNDLKNTKEKLTEKIRKIESCEDLNFYIAETFEIIKEYRKILETPIKMNFSGKIIKNADVEEKKEELIHKYLEIARKYTCIENQVDKKYKLTCDNCKNTEKFEVVKDNVYICLVCFSSQTIFKNITSYKDIDRVNMGSKYTYDRKVHFRDCINQYQGNRVFKIFFVILNIFKCLSFKAPVSQPYSCLSLLHSSFCNKFRTTSTSNILLPFKLFSNKIT